MRTRGDVLPGLSGSAEIPFASFGPNPAWGRDLFLAAWLAFWGVSLVMLWQNRPGDGADISVPVVVFLAGWLGIWLPGGLLVAVVAAYEMFGRETVFVDASTLRLVRAMGPLSHEWCFELAEIGDVRPLPSRSGSGFDVAFSHRGYTVRVGKRLARTRADAVARALGQRVARARPRQPGGEGLELATRRNVVGTLFTSCWLVAWIGGGSAGLLGDRARGGELAGFAAGWTLGFVIGLALLYALAVRRTVTIRAPNLTVRTHLGPLGFSRTYLLRDITNARAVGHPTDDGPDDESFDVVFDYDGRKLGLDLRVTIGEAEAVARELAKGSSP